jgi:hypothetical protein
MLEAPVHVQERELAQIAGLLQGGRALQQARSADRKGLLPEELDGVQPGIVAATEAQTQVDAIAG